jgi:hypothetical protein
MNNRTLKIIQYLTEARRTQLGIDQRLYTELGGSMTNTRMDECARRLPLGAYPSRRDGHTIIDDEITMVSCVPEK